MTRRYDLAINEGANLLRLIRDFEPIATNETVVVVPCFNEADRLDVHQFIAFLNANRRISIIFVDDGSKDQTFDVLAEIRERCPEQVEVLELGQNMGKAAAVWFGLQAGFKKYPSYIAYWDADLATPLSELLRFRETLKQLGHVHLLLGSRFPMMGHVIERKPSRKILSQCFSLASRTMIGIGARDTQCGAKMFRVSKELRRILDRPFKSRWLFDIEILARIKNSSDFTGHSVYELGLAKWTEVNGSKLRLRDFFQFPLELLSLAFGFRNGRVDEQNSEHENAILPSEPDVWTSSNTRKAA